MNETIDVNNLTLTSLKICEENNKNKIETLISENNTLKRKIEKTQKMWWNKETKKYICPCFFRNWWRDWFLYFFRKWIWLIEKSHIKLRF